MSFLDRQKLLDEAQELGLVIGVDFPKNTTNDKLSALLAAKRVTIQDATDDEEDEETEEAEQVLELRTDGTTKEVEEPKTPVAVLQAVPAPMKKGADIPVLVRTGNAKGGKPVKLLKIEGATPEERIKNFGGNLYRLQKGRITEVPRDVRDHFVEKAKVAVDVRPPLDG